MSKQLQIIIVLIVLVIVFLFFGVLFFDTQDTPTDPFFGEELPSEDLFATTDADGQFDIQTDVYAIAVAYPTDEAPGAARVRAFIEDETRLFITQAEADSNALANTLYAGAYTLDIRYEMYEVGGVTSYVVSEYQYTGGANGLATVETFVMDGVGEDVSLADVVPVERRGALVAALQSELRELNGIQAGSGGVFAQAIDGLGFENIEHFYVTDTELVIAFSEYEVAPGAAGVVEVRFPLGEYTSL